MTDPLARELTDRVLAATPTWPPPFEEIRRRARRHRARNTLLVAASAAVIAGLAIGSWSLRVPSPDAGPQRPSSTPSPTEDTPPRTDPAYKRSEYPSGLVIRLPERDVDLPAETSCWTSATECRRALLMPGDSGPDVGTQGAIDFWFARPDWRFDAVFRRTGEGCPRATSIEATRAGDQWFRLTPADQAGRYEVDLYGEGPEGSVIARFVWTTTSNGPVDPPKGAVALLPESRGKGSYGVEVTVEDLAFHPRRSELSRTVAVTVTATDGRVRTLSAPLVPSSLDCGPRGSRGSFYYQMEWDEKFASLGRRPLDLEVTMKIRGTTHIGRATWQQSRGGTAYTPLTFTPPLSATDVD